ncbi:MAG: ABC transporter ATP-binding protein [Verrucomicrobiota bacterium]|nr:ABC transporter ATP-binding protein [Verrucomicrobiota bacterium]
MTSTPAVQITNLGKTYILGLMGPRVVAVDAISLSIHSGEIFGLLGPNGSGKSTTLKILLGLLRPSAGTAKIFGKTGDTRGARANIGYLPESPHFYRFLTGRELLEFYGRLSGVPAEHLDKRVKEVLFIVKLEHSANRTLASYSKGMLQRIGLASAIIHDPALIILDEPTAGMDPEGVNDVGDIILELKRRDKTIILCSHALTEVEKLCDRVAIMHRGRILCEGTLDTLLSHGSEVQLHLSALPQSLESAIRDLVGRHGQQIININAWRDTLDQVYLRATKKE